jgi:DNA topoisomerase-3
LIINNKKVEGIIKLDKNFLPVFEETVEKEVDKDKVKPLTCPICKKGTMLKGNSAYGCSRYKEGCRFVVKFSELKEKFQTDILSTEILKNWI